MNGLAEWRCHTCGRADYGLTTERAKRKSVRHERAAHGFSVYDDRRSAQSERVPEVVVRYIEDRGYAWDGTASHAALIAVSDALESSSDDAP